MEQDNNQEPKRQDKIIDVTKPKSEPVRSSIDASRVSEHTMREQQALEKLRKQVGASTRSDNRSSKIKSIVAIILIIILIILIYLVVKIPLIQ